MKDLAIQTARETGGSKYNVLREYLQNYLLVLMQKTKMNESLYFVGGTALRFLYKIRRYSEDMDFSAGKGWKHSDLSLFKKEIGRELERAGYTFYIRLKEEKTIQRMMVRFAGLLFELGLSGRREQNFSVHIEVDINPPKGGREERTIVNIHHPVLIRHLDLSSAFAGKLAAVLMRPYTKGRDIFDLFWFRSRWKGLKPNFVLLNNAIVQQKTDLDQTQENNWLDVVRSKIETLDWPSIVEDVKPFLESEDDLLAFTRDGLFMLL